jgi:hypothetical protein
MEADAVLRETETAQRLVRIRSTYGYGIPSFTPAVALDWCGALASNPTPASGASTNVSQSDRSSGVWL